MGSPKKITRGPVSRWEDIPGVTIVDGKKHWTLKGLNKWKTNKALQEQISRGLEKGKTSAPTLSPNGQGIHISEKGECINALRTNRAIAVLEGTTTIRNSAASAPPLSEVSRGCDERLHHPCGAHAGQECNGINRCKHSYATRGVVGEDQCRIAGTQRFYCGACGARETECECQNDPTPCAACDKSDRHCKFPKCDKCRQFTQWCGCNKVDNETETEMKDQETDNSDGEQGKDNDNKDTQQQVRMITPAQETGTAQGRSPDPEDDAPRTPQDGLGRSRKRRNAGGEPDLGHHLHRRVPTGRADRGGCKDNSQMGTHPRHSQTNRMGYNWKDSQERAISKSGSAGELATVCDAEMRAIAAAPESTENQTQILILSDSQAAIARIEGVTKGTIRARNEWERNARLCEGCRTKLAWIKAHIGLPGNKMADRLAKEAATEGQGEAPTADGIVQHCREMQKRGRHKWKTAGWGSTPLARFTNCMTNRGPFGTWLTQFFFFFEFYSRLWLTQCRRANSTKCQCGHPVQDGRHVALECEKNEGARRKHQITEGFSWEALGDKEEFWKELWWPDWRREPRGGDHTARNPPGQE
ncbi:hypothetical protein DFH27DRAFT_641471 [Peziza echinospora]|nr:hypothetical protein DFH27DRAFT_641471 [Peziza echinospora]